MDSTRSQSAGKTEVGWLAGMMDGEGSLGIYHRAGTKFYLPRCTIINTDERIIEAIHTVLTELECGHFIQERNEKGSLGKRRQWIVNIHGLKRARKFLELIEPGLRGVKKIQAQRILAFIYSRLLNPKESQPYTEQELWLLSLTGNLNDHKPEVTNKVTMIWSELHRQYAEANRNGLLASHQRSK